MATLSTDHWIVFGDGNSAQVIDTREYTDAQGVKMVRFILKPSDRTRDMYDIDDELDEMEMGVWDYPKVHVIPLERGNYRSRYVVELDFLGGQTILSRRVQDLTEALKDAEKLLRSAEAAKNRAYEELRVEREQQHLAMKQKVGQILEAMRARGQIGAGGEGMDFMDQQEPRGPPP